MRGLYGDEIAAIEPPSYDPSASRKLAVHVRFLSSLFTEIQRPTYRKGQYSWKRARLRNWRAHQHIPEPKSPDWVVPNTPTRSAWSEKAASKLAVLNPCLVRDFFPDVGGVKIILRICGTVDVHMCVVKS